MSDWINDMDRYQGEVHEADHAKLIAPTNTIPNESLEDEKRRVFGECGGQCGEAPCVTWNEQHRRPVWTGVDWGFGPVGLVDREKEALGEINRRIEAGTWPQDEIAIGLKLDLITARKFAPLVVTRNGVPLEDQKAGVEEFKAACAAPVDREKEAIFGTPVAEGPNYRPVTARDLREYSLRDGARGSTGKSVDAILRAVAAALAGKTVLLVTGGGSVKIELARPTVQQVQDARAVTIGTDEFSPGRETVKGEWVGPDFD